MSIKTRTSGIMVNINVEPASAPVVTATWDPGFHSTSIDLSNGDLTGTLNTGAAGNSMARATISATSGKKYWENICDDPGSGTYGFGICNELMLTTQDPGGTVNSLMIDTGGNVIFNSGVLTTVQGYAAGNTVCVALDIGNAKIWFRTNGGNWNNSPTADPATNTEGIAMSITGTIYPLAGAGTVLTAAFTTNFGATAYAQSVPSGFSNW